MIVHDIPPEREEWFSVAERVCVPRKPIEIVCKDIVCVRHQHVNLKKELWVEFNDAHVVTNTMVDASPPRLDQNEPEKILDEDRKKLQARRRWKIFCLVKESDTVADSTQRQEKLQERGKEDSS